MTATHSIEDRLRAVEDKLEILNLIASHPPAADTGADYYTKWSFTEDGVIDLGGGKGAAGEGLVAEGEVRGDAAADRAGAEHEDAHDGGRYYSRPASSFSATAGSASG